MSVGVTKVIILHLSVLTARVERVHLSSLTYRGLRSFLVHLKWPFWLVFLISIETKKPNKVDNYVTL